MGGENCTASPVCLQRALRLYLQQAPVDVLVEELKASAAQHPDGATCDEAGPPSLPWTSLEFQEKVAALVLESPVAVEFPPRVEYVSRVTKVLLQEVEAAGDEPAEGLLLARMACASSIRAREEGMMAAGGADDTAFESFWFPEPTACCNCSDSSSSAGVAFSPAADSAGASDTRKQAAGAFFSFRVANRDNEVGLRVWEAGRALAEFCLAHSGLLEGKRVLELGAGIGMTGMAAAACCGASEVVLTDYAPRVLANLHFNVEINRPLLDTSKRKQSGGSGGSPANVGGTASLLPPPRPTRPPPTDVSVRFLDWTDYCQHDGTCLPVSPANEDTTGGPRTVSASTRGRHSAEVVLAADVVYDVKYHPALVGVVVETLRRCPDALVVFASTLRNSATMAAFHRCLDEAGVPWKNVPSPAADAAAKTKSTTIVSSNSPPYRGGQEGGEEVKNRIPATASTASGGIHGYTSAWRRSDVDSAPLWCHPGDLERVKFCVCGRGVGLVPT
ncbi:unnamed protein product [Scytosiphon promiscuus]